MNWKDAVKALRAGKKVRRVSDSVVTRTEHDVWEEGRGPLWLSLAWDPEEDREALVLVEGPGTPAGVTPEEREATDWIIVRQVPPDSYGSPKEWTC